MLNEYRPYSLTFPKQIEQKYELHKTYCLWLYYIVPPENMTTCLHEAVGEVLKRTKFKSPRDVDCESTVKERHFTTSYLFTLYSFKVKKFIGKIQKL